MSWRLVVMAVLMVGCKSKPPVVGNRPALVEQILRPRPGFEGRLTNHCTSCTERMVEYDLRDAAVRGRLLDARFICAVGMKRFRPCRTLPGLCHQTHVSEGWGPWKKKKVRLLEVLDIERDYQTLLDLNTVCAAQDSDVGRDFFDKDT